MKNKINLILAALILIFVGLGVYANIQKQNAVDRSRLPQKVQMNRGFQRWLNNLKNKGIDLEADDFKLTEKDEIYNAKWMKVSSTDEPGKKDEFEQTLLAHQNLKKVVFSPSEREFVDYRPDTRDGYKPNEVHFYGLKEDKIIDARILDCSVSTNCYFDRAYFLDNDVFVISEISRNVNKRDPNLQACAMDVICTYSAKVHVIDLINNARYVYESKSFDTVLSTLIPQL
jgi:hypothetical protein